MANDLEHLMERVSQLPDEDLLRIITRDFGQYRKEAIAYAKAEAQRRSLSLDDPYVGDTGTLENQAKADKAPISKGGLHGQVFTARQ